MMIHIFQVSVIYIGATKGDMGDIGNLRVAASLYSVKSPVGNVGFNIGSFEGGQFFRSGCGYHYASV